MQTGNQHLLQHHLSLSLQAFFEKNRRVTILPSGETNKKAPNDDSSSDNEWIDSDEDGEAPPSKVNPDAIFDLLEEGFLPPPEPTRDLCSRCFGGGDYMWPKVHDKTMKINLSSLVTKVPKGHMMLWAEEWSESLVQ